MVGLQQNLCICCPLLLKPLPPQCHPLTNWNVTAGRGVEEEMGGMRERGVRERGGVALSSGRGGKEGGRKKTRGGGAEMMAGRGHLTGGANTEGARLVDGQVIGRVLTVSTEGRKAEGRWMRQTG